MFSTGGAAAVSEVVRGERPGCGGLLTGGDEGSEMGVSMGEAGGEGESRGESVSFGVGMVAQMRAVRVESW